MAKPRMDPELRRLAKSRRVPVEHREQAWRTLCELARARVEKSAGVLTFEQAMDRAISTPQGRRAFEDYANAFR